MKLSIIFKTRPTVVLGERKLLKLYLAEKKEKKHYPYKLQIYKFKNYKFAPPPPLINSCNIVQNKNKNVTVVLTDGADCLCTYLARCKKHNNI